MKPALSLLSPLALASTVTLSASVAGAVTPAPSEEPPARAAVITDSPPPPSTPAIKSPFERTFGFGLYGTGWAGSYAGAGVGGRIRVEPWRYFGIDLFGEALMVEAPNGIRHDHPIGFNLYVPVHVTPTLRVRPLLGMCVVASFIEPQEKGAPRADDVLVGAHLGVGVERALDSRLSVFLESQVHAWMGHDRAVQGWTGAVGNDLKPFAVAQAVAGFTAHFGAK